MRGITYLSLYLTFMLGRFLVEGGKVDLELQRIWPRPTIIHTIE